MIVASLLLLAAMILFVVLAYAGRSLAWTQLALGVVGLLAGVTIIMLSGRAVGLVWLLIGGALTITSIEGIHTSQKSMLKLGHGWAKRIGVATILTLPLVAVLQWEPPAMGLPLAIEPLEIAETMGVAFGHHTWALVGVALLAILAMARRSEDWEE